ncbi:ferric reductase NAD binding domain-containing protein [Mycena filopes]|nr:ferric reductase NAD binding domain-containing protein [Mycena filopes]
MDSPALATMTLAVGAQKPDPDRIPRILLANLYPKQVWYFMASFIALVSAAHFAALLHARVTRARVPPRVKEGVGAPLRHGVKWRRLPLATLNLFRTLAFRWSLTLTLGGAYTLNVADFLLAGMYLAVIFTWTFINSKNTLGVRYDPKYWANRCAHIAGSQLPLMTAFGMKNNPISFLTGISFDKLEHLHRVMARVICVMFWVHAAGRAVLDLGDDASTYWFHIGVVGASALTLLCVLSVRPLRARAYEYFLWLHLGLGALALAGAWVHAGEFGYASYIWPAVFLWALDRALRGVRIGLVNSGLFPGFLNVNSVARDSDSKSSLTTTAHITLLPPHAHFLRITLPRAPPRFRWRAGQSAYITFPSLYMGSVTEAHPFTIANPPPPRGEEGREGEEGGRELVFILRVRTGFTGRLREAVLASSAFASSPSSGVSSIEGASSASIEGNKDAGKEPTLEARALIDGPYGAPPDVRGYERVVFVCGGSGVSFALPLFLSLVGAARTKNPRCRRVVFVWAIREPDQITWIADALLAALPPTNNMGDDRELEIEIRLHVTSAPEDTQALDDDDSLDDESALEKAVVAEQVEADAVTDATVTDEKAAPVLQNQNQNGATKAGKVDSAKTRLLAHPSVHLVHGRPDLGAILGGEITSEARGAVGVCVCGTAELADGVRKALRAGMWARFLDVLRGGPSVVLHVEGFGSG